MKFLLKIILGTSIFLTVLYGIVIIIFKYENYHESRFHNIKIPESFKYEKTIRFLSQKQIDSLKTLKVNKNKILVIGRGYNGYSFYMWHKPTQKGEIFIKAFELTQNIQLSEQALRNKTKNLITKLDKNYKLYEGHTVIYEGTFENFYPTRFELWFKSDNSGIERKLTEKNYLIDGWDR